MRIDRYVMMGLMITLALFTWSTGVYAEDGIVFTDQTGRTVELKQPVKRVVTIPIPAASMFIAMDGGADKLVGMHPRSKSALEEGILKQFFPQTVDIRSDLVGNGFMPNVEEMLIAQPDVVFQWGHLGADVVDPLVNAGLNVALFMYGTQEYLEGWIKTFGQVAGKPEKAEKILEWHHATQDDIKKKVAEIPASDRPRVLYFVSWLSNKEVAGSGTYNDYYIDLAGGVNPAKDMKSFPEVSEEQIIAWDPEVILLNGFESKLEPKNVYENEKLADVSAVKNHRVYKVPLGGYRWDPPNQESPLMWKWLTMIFHPDRFQWDLRGEIVEKYQFIYGHTPTDQDMDGILRVTMNQDAANYERFLKK